jgi:hypothetical protein
VVGGKWEVLRFLLWRLLGVVAVLLGVTLTAWFLRGGPGKVLRGNRPAGGFHTIFSGLPNMIGQAWGAVWGWAHVASVAPAWSLGGAVFALGTAISVVRLRARHRRRYVRLKIEAYRADRASAEAIVGMFEALHKRLLRRWWRRLLLGQPTVALEVHHATEQSAGRAVGREDRPPDALGIADPPGLEADPVRGVGRFVWLAVTCPKGLERGNWAVPRTITPRRFPAGFYRCSPTG